MFSPSIWRWFFMGQEIPLIFSMSTPHPDKEIKGRNVTKYDEDKIPLQSLGFNNKFSLIFFMFFFAIVRYNGKVLIKFTLETAKYFQIHFWCMTVSIERVSNSASVFGVQGKGLSPDTTLHIWSRHALLHLFTRLCILLTNISSTIEFVQPSMQEENGRRDPSCKNTQTVLAWNFIHNSLKLT